MKNNLLEKAIQAAQDVADFPLGECGPSDDLDKQTAYIFAFKDIAKRFYSIAKRIENQDLQNELKGVDFNLECMTEAYDLKSDLIGAIEILKELNDETGGRKTMAGSRPIFISHAVADEELVKKLINLLQTGMDIQKKKYFVLLKRVWEWKVERTL